VGALWAWCDGRSTLNELAQKLARQSRRTLREARAEVRAFCAGIAAQNLLTPATMSTTNALPHAALNFSALNAPASFNTLGLGHGPRLRPSPRGNSGPG
jgi:hypothetical protein